MEDYSILNKPLITGGSGMIGRRIKTGYKPTSREMDVTDNFSITHYLNSIENNISCVVHLAALNLRDSENNKARSISVNLDGTINMLNVAIKYNIPFILVSSGAVFSSVNKNDKFNEFCNTSPKCFYGLTKNTSEKIALTYKKSIVIRTGWLFGGDTINNHKFVETTVNNLNNNREVFASVDFVGSPTYVVDFIKKMQYLISNNLYGIHHVVNSEKASGYDIANKIAILMNKDTTLIVPVNKEKIPNAGPYRSSTEVLESTNVFNIMRSWQDAICDYLNENINNIITKEPSNIEEPYKKMWSNRTHCRLCNGCGLKNILKLKPTPPANNYVSEPVHQELIPLDLLICDDCKHIQLKQIVEPERLYRNYMYASNASKIMEDHLISSIDNIVEYNKISKNANILEIGANDGTCVKNLLDNGFTNVIGIDPAINLHKYHNLPIICDFFNSKITDTFANMGYNSFKLIYAFHCCAHIEDIQDIFTTIHNILDDDGIFVMEVGYFYEVFKKKLFDTIYHEHIDYHTCTVLQRFAKSKNLNLYDTSENNIQGGSIRFFFSKDLSRPVTHNVMNSIQKESSIQLFNIENLTNWQRDITLCRQDISCLFNGIKSCGKKIAGYGASAKSTTFLYHYGLSKDNLEFIIDDSVLKQNLHTPGLNIPIKPMSILDKEHIDYIIILSWNFTTTIIDNLKKYRSNGLRIIIPFPEITIV